MMFHMKQCHRSRAADRVTEPHVSRIDCGNTTQHWDKDCGSNDTYVSTCIRALSDGLNVACRLWDQTGQIYYNILFILDDGEDLETGSRKYTFIIMIMCSQPGHRSNQISSPTQTNLIKPQSPRLFIDFSNLISVNPLPPFIRKQEVRQEMNKIK